MIECRRIIRRGRSRPLVLIAIVLLAQGACVAPFVVGTTVGTPSVAPNAPHQHGGNVVTTATAVAAVSKSTLQMSSSSTASTPTGEQQPRKKKRKKLFKFLASLTPTSGKDDGRWKGGEANATFTSRLLFRYASPLLDLAAERELDANDAFVLPQKQKMGSVVPELSVIYKRCQTKARKRTEQQRQLGDAKRVKTSQSMILLKALLLHQRQTLVFTGILRLINTGVQAFPAILVARLLRLLEAGEANPASKAVSAAVALVAVLLVKMITENQYFHGIVKCATEVRGSLAGLIFDKSIRLPTGGDDSNMSSSTSKSSSGKKKKKRKKKLGAGEVLNLMQSDASLLESTALQLHTIWDGPLQITIYTTLLFQYLGPSVIYGIGVLLLTIPLNSVTLRLLNRLSKFENEAKDLRTKRTTESISNMKILKLQAWEEKFADDIRVHRREELRRHVSRGAVRAMSQAISNAVPALTLVVTLTAYSKSGRPIVASTIFTAISLFNQLRFPLFFYPMLIDSLANGKNALRRISSYLSSEELTPYVHYFPPLEGGGGSIELKNGNFLWTSNKKLKDGEATTPSIPALSDINLHVKPGEVVAVIGSVGSGKSALIKGLLGELAPVPRMVVDQSEENVNGKGDFPAKSHAPGIMDVPTVTCNGDIAYCSQEAWLPKGTIRDAVVFGREYDEERYLAALRDAGLDSDIVESIDTANSKAAASSGVLSHDTDVGEGGSSLSGGQRARVALARSLYDSDNSKVFLLDDPLAALDASVGATVFERVTGRLRKSNAATVFVTNDPSIPRRCDKVILMGKCSPKSTSCSTILDAGTYDELIARGHDIRSFAAEHNMSDEEESEEEEDDDSTDGLSAEARIEPAHILAVSEEVNIRVVGGYEIPSNETVQTCHADPDSQACKDLEKFPDYVAEHVVVVSPEISEGGSIEKPKRKKVEKKQQATVEGAAIQSEEAAPEKRLTSADDVMTTGAVPLSTYITYMKSVRKPILIAGMLFAYLLANSAQFYQQFIVAKWTEIGRGDALAAALGMKYLRSLINAAGVVSVCLWLRSYLTMRVGVRASESLHNRMLSSVFNAPMSFFDATPSGQLLSRFGKEMETVDRALPDGIGSVLFCFLQIGLSGLALAGVITPAMLVPLGVIGVLYVRTMTRFRPAARDLKRSESKSRSPVYTHFGEALRGAEIIRSIPAARKIWSSQHRSLTDQNLSVFSSVKALDRWLSIRLEALGNVIVFAAAVAAVFLTRMGRLKSGSAGWGLTQALSITGLLTWAVRCLTDLETYMMSVMRVKELTDLDSDEVVGKLPDEEESAEQARMPHELTSAGEALSVLFTDATALNMSLAPLNDKALVKDGWPWKGGIKFKEVSMRYNPISPLVLKDVDLTVPPGTTLGVVGRTGSGKSSLLLTLFRLVEIEKGGSIEIDGVDIRSISMQTLRESLSIIPQDPVLFAGTIMYNLDAMGKASEADAWAALEAASPELAQQFRNSGQGLNTHVSEGGKNLSLGQRQLLCLARALLRKSKILVLDEATSSVDSKTDAQVQATIRREFVNKGVTVITVAHRLDTILGYDKIAVLGSGELVEYGTPSELLKNRSGELRRLVDADRQNKNKGANKESSAVPA